MIRKNNFFYRLRIILAEIIIFFAVFYLGTAASVQAQSLYLSPASGQFSVLSGFSVKFYMESSGAAVNAAKATINFPIDFLEVKSVSKEGSVFKLWPEEPVFSNTEGKVSFSGGVPSPGFTGTGKVFTISFKVKKEGNAALSVSDGALLKADGRGTNILSRVAGADYKLVDAVNNVPEGSDITPEAFSFLPEIYSTSHPDQNQWYRETNVKINWKNSANVAGVSVKLDNNSFSDPGSVSQGIFDSKSYENIKDGIWYFHLRAKSHAGWSRTYNFKINIDTAPPESFNIKIDNYGDLTSPQPSLYFETKDKLSGIKNYEVKIDDKNAVIIDLGESNPFVLPIQPPGTHSILILAADRAGNKIESRAEFEIKSIEIPEILIYTKAYNAGNEIFYLEGTSAPNSKVNIFFEGSGRIKIWHAFSDSNGNWSFLTDELFKSGFYNLYAKSGDNRGAISDPSPKQDVEVILNGVAIGSFLISYYDLLFVIVVFILLITILTVLIYKKFTEERIKIKKEVIEAQLSLEAAFKNLRKKIIKRIEYFDGKPGLSPEEKKMKDEIVKILNNSEKIVGKEIMDIEKEIK